MRVTKCDSIYLVLLLSMTLTILPPQVLAQPAQEKAAVLPQPIMLSLSPYADSPLKTVDVKIGAEIVPFLFDTAGGVTVVTPKVADRLGCKPFGQVTGFRADGEKISMKRCGPVTLQIGAYETSNEVGVFDLMGMIRHQVERARKQGHDLEMPPTVGGLMGLSSFKHQTITLDYAHNRVIIETPQSAQARIKTMQPVSIRVATEANGSVVVFLQARAQTGTLWLEFDSGNNGPTFLASHAVRQLGITLPKGEKKSLSIDLIGLGNVPATVARRPMIYDGQMGIAMIRKLVLTVDLANGRAWATFSDVDD